VNQILSKVSACIFTGVVMATPVGFLSANEVELGGMPPALGAEETYYACSACHSIKLVVQQGLSRRSWEESLEWMVEEQEMEPLEPKELKLILDYLSKYYGPDRRARAAAMKKR